MSSGILLRMKHIRQAKFCADGARKWFAAREWNWSDFLANGRAVEDFEATGDPLALKAAAFAREEAEHGGA